MKNRVSTIIFILIISVGMMKPKDCLDFLSIEEIYYLWQLAGGDIMTGTHRIFWFS